MQARLSLRCSPMRFSCAGLIEDTNKIARSYMLKKTMIVRLYAHNAYVERDTTGADPGFLERGFILTGGSLC